MKRPIRMLCGGLAVAGWIGAQVAFAAEPRLPNIVIIFCDDMGYADVGVFGAKGYATPHLDRMATEGVRFTHFHVSSAVCSASRAALMTGCYHARVSVHGAFGPGNLGLNPAETTLAQILKARGYATGMAGKWHLGSVPEMMPLRRGFDEYFGIPYSNDMWPRHPERPNAFPPLPLFEGETVVNPDVQPADQERFTAGFTERAVKFIAANKDRPFFFYLAHPMPHVPLYAGDAFRGTTDRRLYGDVIAEIDWSAGQVLAALKEHGLDEHTLVIFTSDNGPWLSYGDHSGVALPLREGKGTSWEGGTRVPFIARWPGRIPAGAVQTNMAMTIDLLPTIANLTGASLPKLPIDGKDVWPLLSAQPGAKNPHEAYFIMFGGELHAVHSEGWKLVLPHRYRTLGGRPGGTGGIPVRYEQGEVAAPELYHLDTDIEERRNVADGHPDIVARLLKYAEGARADLGDKRTQQTGSGVREVGKVNP